MRQRKIELRKVGKIKNGAVILRDINLIFISGERHIIAGPSGAGKSTLLRLLNRLEDPSSGEIMFDMMNTKNISVLELRRKVGMVFQIPVTFEGTVKDNLTLPYRFRVESDFSSDETELVKALESAELDAGLLDHKASSLSVGERQRLNVARALINKPEVILLDEPTSALDSESAVKLLRSIRELNELLGLTVVMVTHQLEHARFFGGEMIYMADGTLVRESKSETLLQSFQGNYS